MSVRPLRALVVAALAAAAVACGRPASAPGYGPAITIQTPASGAAYVEVSGLAREQLDRLRDASLSPEQWSAILRVAVSDTGPAMLGDYRVFDGSLRFLPMFPLDRGRDYRVRFDPAAVPGAAPGQAPVLNTVRLEAEHTVPSTKVARVYPSGDSVPANLLRMYVEFSGPMGRPSGVPFMKVLDENGAEIAGTFLPLDYEFWSPDHTRFTAFLDPGRVKQGILPNQQMGRALIPGKTVTLVISRDWKDQHGLPLTDEYRRLLRVGPPDAKPLDPATWRVEPPAPETRNPLVVSFPEPLDHGLLMRALGVRFGGSPLQGEIAIDDEERRWSFTPAAMWEDGNYELIALDILEDVAGNQIGRAFEVDNFDTVDKSPNPKTIVIPFNVDTHAHH